MTIEKKAWGVAVSGSAGGTLSVSAQVDTDGEVEFTLELGELEVNAYLGRDERRALIDWLQDLD